MLERIPTVLSAQEILDKAFHKAGKIDIFDPVRYHRIRKTETARLRSAIDNIAETLGRYPRAFPNIDSLRDYNVEVLDIIVGLPKLRKALGSVRWASEKVREIGRDTEARIAKIRGVDGFFQARKRAYGRISDIVNEVDKDLALLAMVRDTVRVLPTVSPDYATVVIAGYPNVGKSSLLAAWTGAHPEIAAYSFTTKHAEVGHFEEKDAQGVATKFQVVDTPGLLDRPDEERNAVEKQAVAALRHTADAVLFVIDPTETSGYSIAQQERLLAQVQEEMAGIPMLIAESKSDLAKTGHPERAFFSTITGEGIEELRHSILELLRFEFDPDLEQDPLLKWTRPGETDEW
jgi:nucleolar GTP-binding protein